MARLQNSRRGLGDNWAVLLISLIALRFALDWSYVVYVNPLFEYAGFVRSSDVTRYIVSWLLFPACIFGLSARIYRPSEFFRQIAICLVLIPLTSLYGLSDIALFPVIVSIAAIHLIYFVAHSPFIPEPRLGAFANGERIGLFLAVLIVGIVVTWMFLSGAVRYFNLDIGRVYEFRRRSAELAATGFFAYLNPWAYGVCAPFIMAWALLKRSWILFAASFAVLIFLYGVTAHKSVLFAPVVILGVWFAFRRSAGSWIIPMGFAGLIALSTLSFIIFGETTSGSLLARRSFYVPAYLNDVYFDFFATNPKVYWSNSVLRGFTSYPFGLFSVPEMIGEFLNTETYANNGFVSSGYAHAGLYGVAFYAVVLGGIFKLVNSLAAQNVEQWFCIAILVTPVMSVLQSSDFFTVMLTHGMALALLLLMITRNRSVNAAEIRRQMQLS